MCIKLMITWLHASPERMQIWFVSQIKFERITMVKIGHLVDTIVIDFERQIWCQEQLAGW